MITIEVRAADNGDAITDTVLLHGYEIRQLRFWLESALRRDDCSAARQLVPVLNDAVYQQALDFGWQQAEFFAEPNLSPHAHPLWRDGFLEGWAARKSDMADRKE
jgi:hypothetical protein